LRIPCLLCRRGYGVKADIRKEDHSRAAQDAAPAELTGAEIGRNQRAIGIACRHPIGRIHKPNGSEDEDHYDAYFDDDNDVVDLCGFVNAHDQQHRGDGGYQHGRGIDHSRRSLPFATRRIKIKRRRAPNIRIEGDVAYSGHAVGKGEHEFPRSHVVIGEPLDERRGAIFFRQSPLPH